MSHWGERVGCWAMSVASIAHSHFDRRHCSGGCRGKKKREVSGFYRGSEERGHARVKMTTVIYGDRL